MTSTLEGRGPLQLSGIPDPAVRYLHQILSDLGFPRGPVDGPLGPATTEGLAAFQTSRGLEAVGYVDRDTLQAMFDPSEETDIAVVQALQPPADAEPGF